MTEKSKVVVRVIDFDGRETDYIPAKTKNGYNNHGVTSIGYFIKCEDGVEIYIHPQTVKRIEIYKDGLIDSKIEQKEHK